jgi:hypothetical protein
MTISSGYVTLEEIKYKLDYTGVNAERDAYVEKLIESASRWIDDYTGRRFYAVTETRYYSPKFRDVVFVDDFLSITTLKTDNGGDRNYSNAWAETDYDLLPENALNNSAPYMSIEKTPMGVYSFPLGRKTVQIAGSFGFCNLDDLPNPVYDACFLGILRLLKRNDTPLGISGSSGVGTQAVVLPKLSADPDITELLARYRRLR